MKSNIFVELSAPEHSHLGKLLCHIYYKTTLLDLLDRNKVGVFGFPHNGGRHTLTLKGDSADIIDFIRILSDEAKKLEMGGAMVELHKVRKSLLTQDKVVYMRLKDINID